MGIFRVLREIIMNTADWGLAERAGAILRLSFGYGYDQN